MSLRRRINQNCRDCIYDEMAMGTWRQQMTLCTVNSCAFHEIRPKTTKPIPLTVLSYYQAKPVEYDAINGSSE